MRRPVVGVTGYRIESEKSRELGFGPRPLEVTPNTYLDCVRESGMIPVPLPTHPADLHDDYLDLLDGLLLTGGPDVTPELYGASAHPMTRSNASRDAFEFGLVRVALERGMPILGICRGLQVLNVALGGTLHQHLPDRSTEVVHSHEYSDGRHAGTKWVPVYHEVKVTDPDLRELAGEVLTTNSYHHQGVARLGDGLAVAARSADGLVVAVRGVNQPILGVQWHPEMHTGRERAGSAPFRWLARTLAASAAPASPAPASPAPVVTDDALAALT